MMLIVRLRARGQTWGVVQRTGQTVVVERILDQCRVELPLDAAEWGDDSTADILAAACQGGRLQYQEAGGGLRVLRWSP